MEFLIYVLFFHILKVASLVWVESIEKNSSKLKLLVEDTIPFST